MTVAAIHDSLGFTRQALPSSFYLQSSFNSFLPSKHLNPSSFTKKLIVRSCPLFTEEKGKKSYYFLLRDLSEVLEDKITSKISQNLKQREEADCRAEAWRELCLPSREQRGLRGQEAPPGPPSLAPKGLYILSRAASL